MKLTRFGRAYKACLTAALVWCAWVLPRPGVRAEPAARDDWVVTASSDWGPGYGAAQAADEIAGENGNYWQTVQGKDRGAWWQVDLGEGVPVRGVKVAWARYEDKYHLRQGRGQRAPAFAGDALSARFSRTRPAVAPGRIGAASLGPGRLHPRYRRRRQAV